MLMFRWRAVTAMIAIALCIDAHSATADAYCAAIPQEVLTFKTGMVIVMTPSRGSWVGVCNLKTTWSDIDPTTCWSWFSTVSNAVVNERVLGFYYQNIDQSACSTIATYEASPPPLYVRIAG